jgi:hypothetical protein
MTDETKKQTTEPPKKIVIAPADSGDTLKRSYDGGDLPVKKSKD